MKISFLARSEGARHWGGDLQVIYALKDSFELLGHEVEIAPTPWDLKGADIVFLSNTALDLRNDQKILQLLGIPYVVLGFHEDTIQYFGPSLGFYTYVRHCLDNRSDEGIPFSLETLFTQPHVIHYYNTPPRKTNLVNTEVLKNALLCIANSKTEAETLRRDGASNVQIVPLSPCFREEFLEETSDAFLKWTGLSSKEYILQVGRFEPKKNQLATILSTKDMDAPLVLIATKAHHEWYPMACIEAIKRWRKGPTLIISQTLPPLDDGNLRILQMPGAEMLPFSLLHSAFAHAGLHLHPAFCEVPGLTYFESTLLGVPTIASEWTTAKDYFMQQPLDGRIEFCSPYDLDTLSKCVTKKMGEKYENARAHPVLARTKMEMAEEILSKI